MQTTISDTLDSLRQPEYTGENRCIPCTVVNVVLAVLGSLVLSVLLTPFVGFVVFALGLAAIYLRGYLVPGTPELTKQYFPDWLLAWFDKEPERPQPTVIDADGEIDPEEALATADAVEPCADEDDLCLTESFASAWHDEIRRLRDEDARQETLAGLFGSDAVSIDTNGGSVSVFAGDQRVAQWPSSGALVADLAADQVLASRAADWTDVAPVQRFGILAGLRSFLDTCPICDAPIVMGENTVRSCCRSWEVLSVHCTECDTELLELDPETLETVA